MCRLYEKFILEYYNKTFPELSVKASPIPWALDDGLGTMLPVMQSDITLSKDKNVLIIDAKYYSHTTQQQFDRHTVSGMLLYAKTDEEIQPDNVYQMSGNKISVKTLDLDSDFTVITDSLDEIVIKHLGRCRKLSGS